MENEEKKSMLEQFINTIMSGGSYGNVKDATDINRGQYNPKPSYLQVPPQERSKPERQFLSDEEMALRNQQLQEAQAKMMQDNAIQQEALEQLASQQALEDPESEENMIKRGFKPRR